MSMDQEKILEFIETIKEIGLNDVQILIVVEDCSEAIDQLSQSRPQQIRPSLPGEIIHPHRLSPTHS